MFDFRKVLFFLSIHFFSYSQITFTDLPKDLQLFPRDTSNSAIVKVSGEVNWGGFKKISLYVKKDDAFFFHKAITLPDGYSNYPFQFDAKVFALPNEYNFKVYLHYPGGDSIKVIERERIVCGDFFVLYGQSNMIGLASIDSIYNGGYDDRLLRNFDYDNGTNELWALKWFSSKFPLYRVGGIGMYLQKLILDKYGIPTCIINGAVGGASIDELGESRLQDNPGALWTTYGKLYSRVKEAKALGKVKAVLWRQGENESVSYWLPISLYPAKFTKMYNGMKSDFGGWTRFYNIQIGIYGHLANGEEHYIEEAGALRDFMRRTKYLLDGVETATTLGIPTVDDFHSSKKGNEQLTREVFQLIERDIYKAPADPELHAPDIQKVYRSDKDNTLTLVFEEGQKMKYPADTTINSVLWQMKNYFYLNCLSSSGCTPAVQSGRAEKNRIILQLSAPADSGYLTYLPSYSRSFPPEQNVHLKNSKGLRALSFYQVSVANILKTPSVDSVRYAASNEINVYFEKSYVTIIERKVNPADEFTEVARVSDGVYTDRFAFENAEKVYYRIRKVSPTSESEYSQVSEYLLNDCNNSHLALTGTLNTATNRKALSIESNQKINASARYYFKGKVELKPGFETKGNATFEASTSGCPH